MRNVALISLVSATFIATLFACSSSEQTLEPPEEEEKDAGTFTREGSTYDSTPSPESGLGEILFRPTSVYSGVDGTHTFVSPIAVYDADSDLTVTASDPSAVTITATKLANPVLIDGTTDNGKYYFLTAKKAGVVTLTATSKGRSVTAKLTITDYAADRWATGKTRYEAPGVDADQACTNCHVNGMAIDHSPATMASANDSALSVTITTGIKPNGTPAAGVPGGHKWNATAAELDGLVTYLRALEPRGFK